MQQSIAKTIAVCVGALLFNLIFWNEKQGVNVLLFDLFIGGVLFQFNSAAFKIRSVQIVAAGTFIAALLIIWHNSLIVKTIHAFSFSIFVGLVQQSELRFLGSAGLVYVFNLFSAPIHFIESLRELPILRGTEQATRRLRSAWLTMLIVPIFFIIYFVANPKFAELSGKVFDQLWNWLSFDLNITRFLFFILGIFLVGGAIWQHKNAHVLSIEQDLTDDLINTQNTYEADDYASTHAADLQDRYKNALNLIVTLNILLLVNNVLDIQNVWFSNNTLLSAGELKQFVHSGTYVLILGIALAIGVTLVLFRGILNFVENAKILRGGAYAWLVQNAVLAVSVGMRNWRYIDAYGLAYKRIGVFIFLMLVVFGLGFIYLKINQKRTFFFFINRSAWAIYGVLLLACVINWDAFISKYNLTTSTKSGIVDARFLLQDVSEKNLKVLLEYRSELLRKMPNQPFSESDFNDYSQPLFKGEGEKADFIDNQIRQKRAHFDYEQSTFSWLSWNYADAQIKDYLATHK
jgi:Domain of unknown function (DUF4173)